MRPLIFPDFFSHHSKSKLVTIMDTKYHTRSLTSLELFFESREWFQRYCGFLSKSLIDSLLWAFCGFSSFVSLSIIWASRSCRSGGRLSSSDGSRRRKGLTMASGLWPKYDVDDEKWSFGRILSSPVVSRFSSAISSTLKGTVGMLSNECHSRRTRRIFTSFSDANYEQFQSEFLTQLSIHYDVF